MREFQAFESRRMPWMSPASLRPGNERRGAEGALIPQTLSFVAFEWQRSVANAVH